jgi:hypothetical protein
VLGFKRAKRFLTRARRRFAVDVVCLGAVVDYDVLNLSAAVTELTVNSSAADWDVFTAAHGKEYAATVSGGGDGSGGSNRSGGAASGAASAGGVGAGAGGSGSGSESGGGAASAGSGRDAAAGRGGTRRGSDSDSDDGVAAAVCADGDAAFPKHLAYAYVLRRK